MERNPACAMRLSSTLAGAPCAADPGGLDLNRAVAHRRQSMRHAPLLVPSLGALALAAAACAGNPPPAPVAKPTPAPTVAAIDPPPEASIAPADPPPPPPPTTTTPASPPAEALAADKKAEDRDRDDAGRGGLGLK